MNTSIVKSIGAKAIGIPIALALLFVMTGCQSYHHGGGYGYSNARTSSVVNVAKKHLRKNRRGWVTKGRGIRVDVASQSSPHGRLPVRSWIVTFDKQERGRSEVAQVRVTRRPRGFSARTLEYRVTEGRRPSVRRSRYTR